MIHRWQIRDRRALNERITMVDREIERITTGFYVSKLDEQLCAHRASQVSQARQARLAMHARQARQASSTDSKAGHVAGHTDHDGDTDQPQAHIYDTPQATDDPVIKDAIANDTYTDKPVEREDICALCDGSMRLVVAKALMCCTICGYSVAYLDSTVTALAYGDDANLSVTFSYKRINHFSEWIARIQAKTTHDVPQATIDTIMGELAASKVNASEVTQTHVRDAMKRLKCKSKLTEYIPHITMRITGKHPPRLTDEMEQLLKLCFIALQAPFAAHAPADRKNFMSYSYVLFRLCQLLGYDDILSSLALLKGKTKLARQDEIFALCCHDLDWEWIPSTSPRKHEAPPEQK